MGTTSLPELGPPSCGPGGRFTCREGSRNLPPTTGRRSRFAAGACCTSTACTSREQDTTVTSTC